jgi:ATP-dependent Clp protease ATP-binding subunit ClpA
MTSNVGARELAKGAMGFGQVDSAKKGGSDKPLKDTFSPEFRNRLDAVITFSQLGVDIIERIVDKFIIELETQLTDKKVSLRLTPDARTWLAKKGYDPAYGARPLARVIHQEIKQNLGNEILFGKLEKGGTVEIGLKDEKLTFSFNSKKI